MMTFSTWLLLYRRTQVSSSLASNPKPDTLQNPSPRLWLSAGNCTSLPSARHSSPFTWSLRNSKDGQKPRSGVVKKEREEKEEKHPIKTSIPEASIHQLCSAQSWNTLPPAIRTTTDRRQFKMLLKTYFFHFILSIFYCTSLTWSPYYFF